MKLLFVYGEEKVKFDNEGNIYNSGTLPTDVWNERYLKISKDIVFMSRKDEHQYTKDEAMDRFNLLNENIKYIELENNTNNIKDYFSIRKRKDVKKKIEKEMLKTDCVIARIPSLYSYYAIDLALKYNKKIIVELVGCSWDSLWNHSLKGKILAIPSYLKLKKYARKSSNVIYVSKNFLQSRYPTLGNHISCSDVAINVDNSVLENRLTKIKESNNNFIFLGTVGAVNVRYKGQQYVIKAMSELVKKGYNLKYVIIGGGNQNYLKDVAKKSGVLDKVVFTGELMHDDVLKYYENIDIYIQPSNAESHGRVILEAMSKGCPCIGSSTGGIPEIVNPEYVFKRKNIKDLTVKLEKMLNSNLDEQVKYSVSVAKEYEKDILNSNRINFMKKILEG